MTGQVAGCAFGSVVNAGTPRAPVQVSWICERPITPDEVRRILATAPGVKIVDDVARNYFPMPKDATGEDDILVGRIRKDLSDPSGKSMVVAIVSAADWRARLATSCGAARGNGSRARGTGAGSWQSAEIVFPGEIPKRFSDPRAADSPPP